MTRRERLIGPWGNPKTGLRYGRPEGSGALDRLGELLEAASGDLATGTVQVAALELHALGSALRRVAAGEDARHVFAQQKVGHRRDDRLRNQTIALVYWMTFAELLAAGDVDEGEAKRRAIARACRQFTDKKLNADTVTRYARKHSAGALDFLEFKHRIGQGPNLSALRKHLAKHSAHIGDGPDLPPLSTTRKRPR